MITKKLIENHSAGLYICRSDRVSGRKDYEQVYRVIKDQLLGCGS